MGVQGYSVSLSYDEGVAAGHDLRTYTPQNADKSLAGRNVILVDCPEGVQQAVNEFYRPAIEAYNEGQKRADRKKSTDYYGALMDGTEGYGKGKAHEKPVYEYVLQIGNRNDNGVTDTTFDAEHWAELKKQGKEAEASRYVKDHLNHDKSREELKSVLIEEVQHFQERYPNFKMIYAAYHDDEPGGTGHVHIGFTPYCTTGKKGLKTRCSLSGALREMGIQGHDGEPALEEWKRDVKDRMTEALQAHGYDRKFMSNEEERLSVGNFKRKKEFERLQAENRELLEKNEELERKNKELEEKVSGFMAPVKAFQSKFKSDKEKRADKAEARQKTAEDAEAKSAARAAENEARAEKAIREAQEATGRLARLQEEIEAKEREAAIYDRRKAAAMPILKKLQAVREEIEGDSFTLTPNDGYLIKHLKKTGQYEQLQAEAGRSYTGGYADMAATQFRPLAELMADAERRAGKPGTSEKGRRNDLER